MESSREILTLQFGNYSNYVGTHWWNIQESSFNYDPNAAPSQINNDVLYREGRDYRGNQTFTPRLLLVDLKGSLKHMKIHGDLYEQPSTDNQLTQVWDGGKVETIQETVAQKPEFQKDLAASGSAVQEKEYNFKNNTESWTDFLYTRYHPRSVNIVKSHQHSATENNFDTFTNGTQLWEAEHLEDELGDKVRQYLEECNSCQGFQSIFDCDDAFSGVAMKCFEHLHDEYGKTNLTVPVFTPRNYLFKSADKAMTDSIRVVNMAMTFSRLADQTDLIIPLGTMAKAWRASRSPRRIQHLQYDADNLYQTSAILASYLDTISLNYRLKGGETLSALCTNINNYGRKVASAAFGLPFPMAANQDLIDVLDSAEEPLMSTISPNTKMGVDSVVQSVVVRGISDNQLKRPLEQAERQMQMRAYRCGTVSDMLQYYFQCSYYGSLTRVTSIEAGMTTKCPYPLDVFDGRFNGKGFRLDSQDGTEGEDAQLLPPPTSVPVIAAVQASVDIANTLEELHREAKRIKIGKINRFDATGLEADEYEEALEALMELTSNYYNNMEL